MQDSPHSEPTNELLNPREAARDALRILLDADLEEGMDYHTRVLYEDAKGLLDAMQDGILKAGSQRLFDDLIGIAKHHPKRDCLTSELGEVAELAAYAGLSVAGFSLDRSLRYTAQPKIERMPGRET